MPVKQLKQGSFNEASIPRTSKVIATCSMPEHSPLHNISEGDGLAALPLFAASTPLGHKEVVFAFR